MFNKICPCFSKSKVLDTQDATSSTEQEIKAEKKRSRIGSQASESLNKRERVNLNRLSTTLSRTSIQSCASQVAEKGRWQDQEVILPVLTLGLQRQSSPT